MNLDSPLFENWPQGHQNSKCRCPGHLLRRAVTSGQQDDSDPVAMATLSSNRADELLGGQNPCLTGPHIQLVRQTCGLEKPNSSGELAVGSFFASCCSLTFKTTADFASLTSRHRWTSALRSPRHGANVRSCLCCGIRSWHETQI